ncbi:MAG: nucleotide exchange factor GrpE [bacterium]
MTKEFQDNVHDQKHARPANEDTGAVPEAGQAAPLPKAEASIPEKPAFAVDTPVGEAAAQTGPNGNTMPESELEANGDAWQDEAGEGENALAEDDGAATTLSSETPESVADKLKNKLRRKTLSPEIKKLKADLEKVTSDYEALKDKYLRLAAEFDNYRKRIDRDFNSRVQSAFAELIVELLPVLDDLERSTQSKSEQQNYESLLDGVKLIQQKFAKVLADRGVEPVQAVGAEFDPTVHDALTEMAVEGKPGGIVLEEHTRGFMFRDRVLRPARVIVSK